MYIPSRHRTETKVHEYRAIPSPVMLLDEIVSQQRVSSELQCLIFRGGQVKRWHRGHKVFPIAFPEVRACICYECFSQALRWRWQIGRAHV